MLGAWAHLINLNLEPFIKWSCPKHTAKDKARPLPTFNCSNSNFVKHVQNTTFHFARAFHEMFGTNGPCQFLPFLGRNTIRLQIKVGIGLSCHEDNPNLTSEELFDFRDPEVSDAFEGVPVVYGITDDKNLAVLVAETSQFRVLMLQK